MEGSFEKIKRAGEIKYKTMFHDLQSLLSGSIKRGGISQQMEEALALEKYKEVTGEFLSSDEADKIRPMYVKNKILTVASLSTEITNKLQEKEGDIIGEINKRLDFEGLRKIKYIT